MKRVFPEGFLWGTATSALQIETPGNHDWRDLENIDGETLDRAIEHDLRREEDAGIIASIGNAYRCSPDWSKLQHEAFGALDPATVDEYRCFFAMLKEKGLHLMLVLHHFANPNWFAGKGGWQNRDSSAVFADYAGKVAKAFADQIDSWNTINEPNVYTMNSQLLGNFPPGARNPFAAFRVYKNLGRAHNAAYEAIKRHSPDTPIGISNATMLMEGEGVFGSLLAGWADRLFVEQTPRSFDKVDYVGISYYGRVPWFPLPVTELDNPGKLNALGREHDDMWEYQPDGLRVILERLWQEHGKPLIITENGCCTQDDSLRIRSIRDHLAAAHQAIENGVNLRGYFHWSTFDNIELHLGPSYRFGLVGVDYDTMERAKKPSAHFYANIARKNAVDA